MARIFLGNITTWNDPAIVALNPKANLTSHAITVVHRSDGSGTMYAFTNYLSDSSQGGRRRSERVLQSTGRRVSDAKATKVLRVASQTHRTAIGPLEIAYEIVNKGLISYGAVENAAGNFVLANLTNIAAAVAGRRFDWTTCWECPVDECFNNRQHIQRHKRYDYLSNHDIHLPTRLSAADRPGQGYCLG